MNNDVGRGKGIERRSSFFYVHGVMGCWRKWRDMVIIMEETVELMACVVVCVVCHLLYSPLCSCSPPMGCPRSPLAASPDLAHSTLFKLCSFILFLGFFFFYY